MVSSKLFLAAKIAMSDYAERRETVNKLEYLRKNMLEAYGQSELADAAAYGEALLRERIGINAVQGMGLANDVFNVACIYDAIGHRERTIELYATSARLTYAEQGEGMAFAKRLTNTAVALSKLGRGEAAYRLFRHATEIIRREESENHPELADSLYNWANAAADISRLDEAIRLHEESLSMRNEDTPMVDWLSSTQSLAFIFEERKEYGKAVEYAQKACELTTGTDEYYPCRYYLAEVCGEDGQYERAAQLYNEILSWIEDTVGRSHSVYITTAIRRANALFRMEEYREALAQQQMVRELLEAKAGGKQLYYANCLRGMAILHQRLEEPDHAEALILQSMKIKKRIMGGHVRDLAADAVFLMKLYLKDGHLDKALEILVYALMHLNQEHPDYEQSVNMLTAVYAHSGQELLQTALAAIERMNDKDALWEIINRWEEWEAQED